MPGHYGDPTLALLGGLADQRRQAALDQEDMKDRALQRVLAGERITTEQHARGLKDRQAGQTDRQLGQADRRLDISALEGDRGYELALERLGLDREQFEALQGWREEQGRRQAENDSFNRARAAAQLTFQADQNRRAQGAFDADKNAVRRGDLVNNVFTNPVGQSLINLAAGGEVPFGALVNTFRGAGFDVQDQNDLAYLLAAMERQQDTFGQNMGGQQNPAGASGGLGGLRP